MLLGILALYFYNSTGLMGWGGLGNPRSFFIPQFHEISNQIPPDLQFWIFLVFFALAFAIKVPMFPLSHLVARRPCRGADGRLGHPGGCPA